VNSSSFGIYALSFFCPAKAPATANEFSFMLEFTPSPFSPWQRTSYFTAFSFYVSALVYDDASQRIKRLGWIQWKILDFQPQSL